LPKFVFILRSRLLLLIKNIYSL